MFWSCCLHTNSQWTFTRIGSLLFAMHSHLFYWLNSIFFSSLPLLLLLFSVVDCSRTFFFYIYIYVVHFSHTVCHLVWSWSDSISIHVYAYICICVWWVSFYYYFNVCNLSLTASCAYCVLIHTQPYSTRYCVHVIFFYLFFQHLLRRSILSSVILLSNTLPILALLSMRFFFSSTKMFGKKNIMHCLIYR